jgi:hypothetical protein
MWQVAGGHNCSSLSLHCHHHPCNLGQDHFAGDSAGQTHTPGDEETVYIKGQKKTQTLTSVSSDRLVNTPEKMIVTYLLLSPIHTAHCVTTATWAHNGYFIGTHTPSCVWACGGAGKPVTLSSGWHHGNLTQSFWGAPAPQHPLPPLPDHPLIGNTSVSAKGAFWALLEVLNIFCTVDSLGTLWSPFQNNILKAQKKKKRGAAQDYGGNNYIKIQLHPLLSAPPPQKRIKVPTPPTSMWDEETDF